MKVLVLSDLHIGDGSAADKNTWNDDDFIFQIEKAKQGFGVDKVILLGDTLELHVFFDSEIVSGEHTKMVNYLLNSPDIILLRGNHDSELTQYKKALAVDNVLFMHGDLADISSLRFIQVLSTWWNIKVLRFLYRKNPEKLRKYLLRIVGTYSNGYRANANTLYYLKYALRWLNKYDMVVMGHTHQMQNVNLFYNGKKKIYLNTGTSLDHLECFIIDTQTLDYKIIRPDQRKN